MHDLLRAEVEWSPELPMTAAWKHTPTHADAAKLEAETGLRHELVDGELFAMAGGTPEHNQLSGNVFGELYIQLKGKPCRVVGSDQKVHVLDENDDAGLYPDVAVYCGPRQRSAAVSTALTNPSALFEVVSDSTEADDRGRKFELYRSLESLQHYVMLSQKRPSVEVYDRNEDGTWTLRLAGSGDRLALSAIGAELVVDDLYIDVFDE